MTFSIAIFEANDDARMAAANHIRKTVFCDEQGVSAELEWDGKDAACVHFLLADGGQPIATARLRPYGAGQKIERVAVMRPHRRKGAGRAIMQAVLNIAGRSTDAPLRLHAQTEVAGFYEKLGFVREGPVFLEADIPHVAMTYRPSGTTAVNAEKL